MPTQARVSAALLAGAAIFSAAPACGPQATPASPAHPDEVPTEEWVARARERCESGHAALERGDAESVVPDLQYGVGALETVGLRLTPENGGDLLAMCLDDLGRAREVVASDDPLEQPEVLYGRSLALRPDDAVADRLRSWLRENGGEECTLGEVRRTESSARVFPFWTSAAEVLSAEVDPSGERPAFADEAEALEFLFGGGVDGEPPRPWRRGVATLGGEDGSVAFLLVPRFLAGAGGDGAVLVLQLASNAGGRCPSEAGGWPVSDHAVGFESTNDLVWEDEEGRACDPGAEGCRDGCAWTSHKVTHQFLDLAAGRVVTIEVQVEGLDPLGDGEPYRYVHVEPFDGRLVLYGCGTRMEFEP